MPIKHYNNNIYQIRFLQIPFIKPKEVNSCYFQELTSLIYTYVFVYLYMCICISLYIVISNYSLQYRNSSICIIYKNCCIICATSARWNRLALSDRATNTN